MDISEVKKWSDSCDTERSRHNMSLFRSPRVPASFFFFFLFAAAAAALSRMHTGPTSWQIPFFFFFVERLFSRFSRFGDLRIVSSIRSTMSPFIHATNTGISITFAHAHQLYPVNCVSLYAWSYRFPAPHLCSSCSILFIFAFHRLRLNYLLSKRYTVFYAKNGVYPTWGLAETPENF